LEKELVMMRWSAIALCVLLVPATARAQDEPEQLLPRGTQLYLRWDGIEAHRAEYEQTALGKMLKGDTGKFIQSVFGQLKDSLGALLTVEQLLQGIPPERLQKIQADAAEAPKLFGLLSRHGFIFAAELESVTPPKGQLTLVIPNAGSEPGPLFSTLRLIAALAREEIQERKAGEVTVSVLPAGPVQFAWWVAGKHVVLTFGVDPVEAFTKRLSQGNDTRLTANPLFQRVRDFKQFPTAARAFVDFAALGKTLRAGNNDVGKLIDDLGFDSLKSVVFYSGFDGDADRGLVELDVPGARTGLVKVFAGQPFRLADAPPLPTDVVSWSMMHFDLATLFDVGVKTAENIFRLAAPDEVGKVKQGLDIVDQVLGVKLRGDLLASLGSRFTIYTSPAEGPLTFGQTYLFEVKDAAKLQESLDQAIKGVARASGLDISVKKRTYHGAELREVHVKQEGFFFVPSYVIHKNWLAIGFMPQSLEGYVLRTAGELPSWKPDERTQSTLNRLPQEFIGISYSDPRPSVKQVLSLAPFVAALVNSLTKDIRFDVGALPNAHEATRYLFPNVSVSTASNGTIHMESRASLELPVDVAGADSYILFFVGIFSARAF
jgi:hypothetical protein